MADHPVLPPPSGANAATWGAVVDEVRAYCGWHIAPEVTETVTVDGNGSGVAVLPTLHLVDLDSITDDGTAVSDPEWSTFGVVERVWTRKRRGVVATITHGYEGWPSDLVAVMVDMSNAAGLGDVSQVTSGAHQVSYRPTASSDRRAVLDRYRLVNIP